MNETSTDEIKIRKLCKEISFLEKGALDFFWELYPILQKYNFSEKVKNTCNFIRSSEDWIRPQNARQYCSKEFIKEMDEAERELIDYYKDDIKIFVQDVLKELKEMNIKDVS